ncbi:MAG: hypothetical protein ABI633_12645 [Burkholderiales bacterium]
MNHQPTTALCAPVRTAVGTYAGTLKDTPTVNLGAAVIRASWRVRVSTGANSAT